MISPTERGMASGLAGLKTRLRDIVLVQHAAFFFSGGAWHNLGKFPELEDASYAQAETLRQMVSSLPHHK